MCELCKGTHVIHNLGGSFIGYHSCPNCGPMHEEKFKQKYMQIRKNFEVALNNVSKSA